MSTATCGDRLSVVVHDQERDSEESFEMDEIIDVVRKD
jgi:phosphotransferase system IIB component